MSNRSSKEQLLHDQVIQYIETHLNRQKYNILTNPGTSKDWSIGGEFPDVIVNPKETSEVLFIIEVETNETVSPEEARNQWKAYSELPGIFYIIVPRQSINLAKQIIAGQGIEAKLGYFEIDKSGTVKEVIYNEQ